MSSIHDIPLTSIHDVYDIHINTSGLIVKTLAIRKMMILAISKMGYLGGEYHKYHELMSREYYELITFITIYNIMKYI